MKNLIQMIQRLDGEIRIVMEATGIYHLPMLSALQDQNFFVAVINPFEMKEYASRGLRRVKTDKLDSITIANYGIDNWYRLENHQGSDDVYSELKLLGRQYCHYMELHVKALLELTHMLDYTMPGVKKEFHSWSESCYHRAFLANKIIGLNQPLIIGLKKPLPVFRILTKLVDDQCTS